MSVFSNIYRPLLSLALPLIFIQVCQASLGLIDTMVAGQYLYVDLAGVGLGSAMWTPVFILFTGIMFVIVPKMSGFAVAGDANAIYTLFIRAKRIAFYLSIAGFVLVQLLAFTAPWLIDDQRVAAVAQQYLQFIAFAMPGLVYVLLYRFCCEGHSQLMPIIKVFVALLLSNTLLNLLFVFGVGELKGLGGAGCGLATAVSAYVALGVIKRLTIKAVPDIQRDKTESLDPQTVKQLFGEGIPIGLAFVIEVLALTALAFFASSLGVKQVAAHQIAINIAMVVFMIPLALSSATTIRIAHFSSINEFAPRKATAKAAILMAAAYGIFASVVIMLIGPLTLHAFSDDETTIALASGLLIFVALFQLFDAIQIVAAGILRGLQQFVSPMLVLLIIYWLIVVPISYLALEKGWWNHSVDITTIWLLLSGGITLAAIILFSITLKKLSDNDNGQVISNMSH